MRRPVEVAAPSQPLLPTTPPLRHTSNLHNMGSITFLNSVFMNREHASLMIFVVRMKSCRSWRNLKLATCLFSRFVIGNGCGTRAVHWTTCRWSWCSSIVASTGTCQFSLHRRFQYIPWNFNVCSD